MTFTRTRAIGRQALSAFCIGAGAMTSVACAEPAQPADAETGYAYLLHSEKPAKEALGAGPEAFDDPTVQYVEQGPSYTAVWAAYDPDMMDPAEYPLGEERFGVFVPYYHDADRATFARGEVQMGLLVSGYDLDRPASQPEGWTSYGRPVDYCEFEFEIDRGQDDRTIAGVSASHYLIEARIVECMGETDRWNFDLSSQVWIDEAKPYSPAPIATDRSYADPRLNAAFADRLGDLGMILRIQTWTFGQAVDLEGTVLGPPQENTHLAWVSDLHAADVRAFDYPLVDFDTMKALREASRENPQETCETLLAGETPEFVTTLLDEEQREAFLPHLRARCESEL